MPTVSKIKDCRVASVCLTSIKVKRDDRGNYSSVNLTSVVFIYRNFPEPGGLLDHIFFYLQPLTTNLMEVEKESYHQLEHQISELKEMVRHRGYGLYLSQYF